MKRMMPAIISFLFLAIAACNSEATLQDKSDSATQVDRSTESNWPGSDEVVGSDTIPSSGAMTDSLQNR